MTYTLAIGDRAYSSWSLRGWLLFEAAASPSRQTGRSFTPMNSHSFWPGLPRRGRSLR